MGNNSQGSKWVFSHYVIIGKLLFWEKGVPNMILVKMICYVNVENNFLTFTKLITFTRIMLGTLLWN